MAIPNFSLCNKDEQGLFHIFCRQAMTEFQDKVDKARICQNCRYYGGKAMNWTVNRDHGTVSFGRGECRFQRPDKDGFPKIKADCWCGHFIMEKENRTYGI